ncbi:hypothetical protein [Glycomyces harbinensis]|uniref:Uncharacterized protein n=1 Tax=Glycomyces harbinensis TaxID=58114 RepID=A0A1G7CUU0_9ACTN|nr:hypothetical protein [Glycomyces harbinensis]SDE42993.1 hypothetical protein SAMN05216270_12141 [Glycomyces harbinensis]
MDVAALAGRLKALAVDLPLPALDTADHRFEAAQAELKEASRESNAEIGLHKLGAARERLAAARTRLSEAAAAVDDYLDSIGAGTSAAPVAAPVKGRTAAPAPVDPRRWWTERVNELCDRTGTADPQQVPPTRLFNELLKAAGDGNAEAYCKRLRDAGPETGVKLPGLAWPLVRTLAAEHLGRTPTARDVASLRDKCADKVRSLVPKAEPDHIGAALASACTLGRGGSDDAGDAARTALVGPALVAALHRLPREGR